MADIAVFTPTRSLAQFSGQIVMEEDHSDKLTITDHPVETGASITDHAFKNPSEVTLILGWSNSMQAAQGDPNYVRQIYADLLALQASRVPFDIVTGKRAYSNMLMTSLGETTDKDTENMLRVTLACREIIIVDTSTAPVPAAQADQAQPQKTAATADTGTKQAIPAKSANVSALQSFVNTTGGGQ